jgi:uncharacterized protein
VTFKLTSSHDRDAIGNWVEGQADKAQWKEIWKQLPTLERGQGYVWLPARNVLKCSPFPEKVTFDSSRAPKRGERMKKAKGLKPVNLDKLKERLAAIEAESIANDPRKLRSEIATLKAEKAKLEQQVAKAPAGKAAAPVKPGKDTAAALATSVKSNKALRAALEVAMKFIVEINTKDFFKAGGEAIDKAAVEKAITDATAHVTKLVEAHLGRRNKEIDALRLESQRVVSRLKALLEKDREDVTLQVNVTHNKPFTIAGHGAAPRPAPVSRVTEGDGSITNPMRTVLKSLAWWSAMGHQAPTRAQVAAIAGWQPTGSNR